MTGKQGLFDYSRWYLTCYIALACRFEYFTLEDLEVDFELMVGNCMSYNERDTIFFRAGVKMRDQGGVIIRQARRMIEDIGFDLKTGLHLEDTKVKGVKKEEVRTNLTKPSHCSSQIEMDIETLVTNVNFFWYSYLGALCLQ